jgi:hypothetical protein
MAMWRDHQMVPHYPPRVLADTTPGKKAIIADAESRFVGEYQP